MTDSSPPPPPPPAPAPGPGQPHPSGVPADVRTYAMLTHLSSFVGAAVALAVLGPLIMWLIKKDDHPFIDHHGKEALNFNLSLLLYGLIGFVLGMVVGVVTFGIGLLAIIPVAFAVAIFWIVVTIMAAVAANRGDGYRYPLSIRFIT